MSKNADRDAAQAKDREVGKDVSDTPAGDSPPLPRWPLWTSAAVWGGWLVFLSAAAYSRHQGGLG
ncbi:MAG: hypothetical protein IID39_04635 [Planctomycetes bacterium]|nr:hypothetical protein [Planctomycetota bacterium]